MLSSHSLRPPQIAHSSHTVTAHTVTSTHSGKYTSRVVALAFAARASPPPCLATIRARSRRCSITFSWPDVGAPRSLSSSFSCVIGHLLPTTKILRAPRQMPSNPTARQGHPSKSGGPVKVAGRPGPLPPLKHSERQPSRSLASTPKVKKVTAESRGGVSFGEKATRALQ